MNVIVQEICGNNIECYVYNKLIWEFLMDDGDMLIISYLVEYKYLVFNRILISEMVSWYREYVICKFQVSGYLCEVYVDVRVVNKVGCGFWLFVVLVLFFSE